MKRLAILVFAIAALVIQAPAARADAIVQFALDNITFSDGSFATGTFTVDETNDTMTAWNVAYTGGGAGIPSTVFTTGQASLVYPPGGQIDFGNGFYAISLSLTAPLADTIDPIVLLNTQGYYSYVAYEPPGHIFQEYLASGNAAAVPIPAPEPLSGLMIATGMVGLGALRQRRKTKTA